MSNIVDLAQVRENHYGRRAKISTSLKRLSRDNRRQLLACYPYMRFWLHQLDAHYYAHFLRLHLSLRESLEQQIALAGEQFAVINQFDHHAKLFSAANYLPSDYHKSQLIRADLEKLNTAVSEDYLLPLQAERLISYMARASDVYSIALLGVLYMLDEQLSFAAPALLRGLHSKGVDTSEACTYLRHHCGNRSSLWRFLRSLDSITDFQTQANVTIAATVTYEMHREMLAPRRFRQSVQRNTQRDE
ncbi:hypothetical protein [Teredinibacter turnerae]|uniref:hypothetical protein n=1 Tax=Teredinibacter turnerae TaxID=2426 RepID=UPI000476D999|nr:hypothetical protein [Teredinibacter turnerae]